LKTKLRNIIDKLYTTKTSLGGEKFDSSVVDMFSKEFELTIIDVTKLEDKYLHRIEPSSLKTPTENKLVLQPNNTQQAPDVYVAYNLSSICIELKTSKNNKPMYNSGCVEPSTLYLYNNIKTKTFTYAFGSSLIADEILELQKEFKIKIDEVSKEINKKIKELENLHPDDCRYKWKFLARPVHSHDVLYDKHRDVWKQEADTKIDLL